MRYKTEFRILQQTEPKQDCGTFLATSLNAAVKQLRRKWGKNIAREVTYKVTGFTAANRNEWCYVTLKPTCRIMQCNIR